MLILLLFQYIFGYSLIYSIILFYLIPSSIFLTEDFASSEFASSNGRFECLENAITGTTYRVDGETKLSPFNIGTHSSSLNSNINNTSINTPSLPASSHTTLSSFCNHGRNSRFVEFVSIYLILHGTFSKSL